MLVTARQIELQIFCQMRGDVDISADDVAAEMACILIGGAGERI